MIGITITELGSTLNGDIRLVFLKLGTVWYGF